MKGIDDPVWLSSNQGYTAASQPGDYLSLHEDLGKRKTLLTVKKELSANRVRVGLKIDGRS